MRRMGYTALLTAAVVTSIAAGAQAQEAPSSATAAPSTPETPATPPANNSVTVTSKLPLRACGERDHDCIRAVAEQLWKTYPKALKVYCNRNKINLMNERMTAMALPHSDLGAREPLQLDMPPALKSVCDGGDQPH